MFIIVGLEEFRVGKGRKFRVEWKVEENIEEKEDGG